MNSDFKLLSKFTSSQLWLAENAGQFLKELELQRFLKFERFLKVNYGESDEEKLKVLLSQLLSP